MKLKEVVEKLQLEVKSSAAKLGREVKGGYTSDMLSDVMANAHPGDIWVTFQTHENMVAVASLNDLAGVITVKGREPDRDVIAKAEDAGVVLLVSRETAYEVVGKLNALAISGKSRS